MSTQNKNMLFYHSFFQDRHWQRTADTIDYELPPEFTGLTITKASMVGDGLSNIAVFSTPAGDLYFMRCVVNSPNSIVSKRRMKIYPPVKSPVGTAASLFTAFPVSKDNSDTLFMAIADTANKIVVHRIETAGFTVQSSDTLSITPPSEIYSTTGFTGGTEYTGTLRSSLWAYGSLGVIRLFSWNGSTWSGEVVYDIDPTETVSAICNTAAGTVSGKIYELSNSKFIYKSQPCSTAINFITADGAVGNRGVVIKKKNEIWTRFTVGIANYRYFNFISRTNGSGVELLTDSLLYSIQTLEDSPTLLTVEPEKFDQYINNGVYQYRPYQQENLIIRLSDPDKNYAVPSIQLNNSVDLTNNGSYKLLNMHPDTVCVPGFVEIADTSISIVLTSTSITISANARTAQYNDISDRLSWKYFKFSSSKNWQMNHEIRITLGSKSLVIRYVFGSPTKSISQTTGFNQKSPIQFQRTRDGLHFILPRNTVNSIRILNLRGQQLAFTKILPAQERIILPCQASLGILCIECFFKDGSIKRHMVPILRKNEIIKFKN